MKYIFCFLFLMGISGIQCHESYCPANAIDCPSICACWNEKKELNTPQTQRWNKKCHRCKPGGDIISPVMETPLSQLNSKDDSEDLETDGDN